jgi:7-cyano-7-deazaguanine synthase in queuosine biosynthesis
VNDILVPWSGGFDSTYLVQHLIESDPNNRVTTFYVELKNNPEKTKLENRATAAMKPVFTRLYGDRYQDFGTQSEFDIRGGGMFGLKQPILWLTACAYLSTSSFKKVAIGYVMNDCAMSFLDDFRNIWYGFGKLSEAKFPELVFPLAKIDKYDVHQWLKADLYPHCVCCEHPEDHHGYLAECGQCAPCKRNGEYRRPVLSGDHYSI